MIPKLSVEIHHLSYLGPLGVARQQKTASLSVEETGLSSHRFISVSVKLDGWGLGGSSCQHIDTHCHLHTISQRECQPR